MSERCKHGLGMFEYCHDCDPAPPAREVCTCDTEDGAAWCPTHLAKCGDPYCRDGITESPHNGDYSRCPSTAHPPAREVCLKCGTDYADDGLCVNCGNAPPAREVAPHPRGSCDDGTMGPCTRCEDAAKGCPPGTLFLGPEDVEQDDAPAATAREELVESVRAILFDNRAGTVSARQAALEIIALVRKEKA